MIGAIISYIIVLVLGVVFFDRLRKNILEFICGSNKCKKEKIKKELKDTLPVLFLFFMFYLIPYFNVALMIGFLFYNDITDYLTEILIEENKDDDD